MSAVLEDISVTQSDASNTTEESAMTQTKYNDGVPAEQTLLKTLYNDTSMATDKTNHEESTIDRRINAKDDDSIHEESTLIHAHLSNGLSEDELNREGIPMKISADSFAAFKDDESSESVHNIAESDPADESPSGDKPYKCYICDKLFSRNSSLKCHIRLHLEGPVNILRKGCNRIPSDAIPIDREDVCSQDNILNSSNGILPNEEGQYECNLCSRTFDRKKGLFRHIGYHKSLLEQSSSKNDVIDDAGSDIDLSLVDESSLEDGNGDSIECSLCGKGFKTTRAMKIHSKHAHRDTRVDQELEMERSTETFEFEEEEEEEQNFECDYCGRVFHSQRARSIHAVHAHKLGGKLPEGNGLTKPHVVAAAAVEKELHCFTCSFCQGEFETARAMNAHIGNEHHDGGSFQCVVCERKFESIKAYSDHGRAICGKAQIQNGMYVYGCDECPKTFAHPKSMSRHVREHRLSEQDQLDQLTKVLHEATTGRKDSTGGEHQEEQFKCAFCVKSYPNVKALAGHMKIHNRETLTAKVYNRANGDSTSSTPTKTSPMTGSNGAGAAEEEVKLYPCPYCDRTFTSNVGYAGHMKVHKDRTPASVVVQPEVVDHNNVVGESEKTFVCRLCDKKFTSGVQLGGHMRHHTAAMKANADAYDSFHADVDTDDAELCENDEQYICDTCDDTFDSKEELSEHVQHHASDAGTSSLGKLSLDGGLLCEYCDRPFNGVKSLKTHMYRYHRSVMIRNTPKVEDKVYKCDSCQQKFTYLSELKKHTTSECLGSFSTSATLKRPLPDDLLKCEYCDQTFLLRCHLQKHMKSRCNAIDLKNEPMEPDCGLNGDLSNDCVSASKRIRKSPFMSSMYEYEPLVGSRRCSQQKPMNMRAEFGDKPFECVYCEKCFSKKEDLLKHVRTHAESQDFDDEDFDNYINLHAEEHFVIQNQEGDEEHFIFEQYDDNEGYQCSECDETYRDKLQMIIHMSFHVNSKLPNGGYKSPLIIKADSTLLAPYKCKFCDERFINKSYRSRHLCKCHRDEILQCEICQKLFLYKETLKQHCKQHAIDTKYQCEYCQKCFTSKWFLKRHTKRHCAKRLGTSEETMQYDDEQPMLDMVDEYHHFNVEEKIETEQADSEIITEHFIKEEIPKSEVIVPNYADAVGVIS